jgi:SAM-dependent methyltransferase
MKMYREFASWWPLVSPPSDYVEEAADLLPTLMQAPDAPPSDVLELGCGGGSLAWHLKAHFRMTLTDISPEMLEQSRQVNPECEHVLGDMRTLDLGRTFDLVFIHDAIMYAIDEASVTAALAASASRRTLSTSVVADVVGRSRIHRGEPDGSVGSRRLPRQEARRVALTRGAAARLSNWRRWI